MLRPIDFFDLEDAIVCEIFNGIGVVWEVLSRIEPLISQLTGNSRRISGYVSSGAYLGDGLIVVEEGARVEPGAFITGPTYIGRGATIRHGAYLRENCIVLQNAVAGHTTEMKNSILLPGAQAPHFAYVGDSILGTNVNIGAGTKLSNLPVTAGHRHGRKDRVSIHIQIGGDDYDTGLRKLGAILGDEVQTGCNAVLNPGTLVGKRTLIYPNTTLAKGLYPADTIIKLRQNLETSERKP